MSDDGRRSRTVRQTWLLYGLLFVFSVPWYFPAGSAEPFVFGFPFWCFVSLCCYVGVAVLTIFRIDSLWDAQLELLEGGEKGESKRLESQRPSR